MWILVIIHICTVLNDNNPVVNMHMHPRHSWTTNDSDLYMCTHRVHHWRKISYRFQSRHVKALSAYISIDEITIVFGVIVRWEKRYTGKFQYGCSFERSGWPAFYPLICSINTWSSTSQAVWSSRDGIGWSTWTLCWLNIQSAGSLHSRWPLTSSVAAFKYIR